MPWALLGRAYHVVRDQRPWQPVRHLEQARLPLRTSCQLSRNPIVISPLALGLAGREEAKTAKTAKAIVFYRQGWWCRMRRDRSSETLKPATRAGACRLWFRFLCLFLVLVVS